jgi:hypothetical protein
MDFPVSDSYTPNPSLEAHHLYVEVTSGKDIDSLRTWNQRKQYVKEDEKGAVLSAFGCSRRETADEEALEHDVEYDHGQCGHEQTCHGHGNIEVEL